MAVAARHGDSIAEVRHWMIRRRPPARRREVDRERIMEVYREGHSHKAVAAIVGRSREAVVRVTREAGVVRPPGFIPRHTLEETCRRTEAGNTLAEIGEGHRLPRPAVVSEAPGAPSTFPKRGL